MSKCLAFILLFITVNSYAQFTISGKIINKTTGKPVASAVAFLNKTGIAATASDSGRFTLKDVPAGHYLLLVTIVGYDAYKVPITVSGDTHLPVIRIDPKNETLRGVTVQAKYKPSPYYYLFRNEFLGSTLFAQQCKIANPWVIIFYNTDKQGNYSAKSDDFIDIENDALGYKIKVLLTYFTKDSNTGQTSYDGNSYFEEMKGTPEQERTWAKNRMECYRGSTMQFLRAILAGTTKQEGFRIRKAYLQKNPYYDPMEIYDDPTDDEYLYKITDTTVSEVDIINKTNRPGLFALTRGSTNPNACMYIEYHEPAYYLDGKKAPRIPWIWTNTDSYILFEKPYTVFDYKGIINTNGNVMFTGFFAEARIANQLPVDFEPTQ